jgi:hypothetical protein
MRGSSLVPLALALALGGTSCGATVPPPAQRASAPTAKSTPAAADEPVAESAIADRLGELLERGLRGDDAALDDAFREMRELARPDERAMVDRLERMVRDVKAADDLDAMLRIAVEAVTDLEKLAPDVTSRLAMGVQAFSFAQMAAGHPSGPAADALALGSSERLVRDFPGDPRALELRAHVLRRIANDLRGALAAARRCAAAPACRELAQQLVREIEAPRCRKASIKPGLALHRGSRTTPMVEGLREIAVGGAPLWISAQPALKGADVEEIVADAEALLIVLTPAAQDLVEPFRRQMMGRDMEAALLVDGKPVGAARRMMAMVPRSVILGSDPAAPLTLESVCTQIVRERAPE